MPHNQRQPRKGRQPQPQPQPTAPNHLQGADPAMVAILDRLIAAEERKQEDAEEFYIDEFENKSNLSQFH